MRPTQNPLALDRDRAAAVSIGASCLGAWRRPVAHSPKTSGEGRQASVRLCDNSRVGRASPTDVQQGESPISNAVSARHLRRPRLSSAKKNRGESGPSTDIIDFARDIVVLVGRLSLAMVGRTSRPPGSAFRRRPPCCSSSRRSRPIFPIVSRTCSRSRTSAHRDPALVAILFDGGMGTRAHGDFVTAAAADRDLSGIARAHSGTASLGALASHVLLRLRTGPSPWLIGAAVPPRIQRQSRSRCSPAKRSKVAPQRSSRGSRGSTTVGIALMIGLVELRNEHRHASVATSHGSFCARWASASRSASSAALCCYS